MRELMLRYVKFLGTSVIGTMVDMLVLWILSDHIFDKGYWGEYVLSPMLSFQAAVLVNYSIFYFYVWKDRVNSKKGIRSFIRLYIAYDISCSTVFLLRLGGLLIIERLTGWDVVLCNVSAMAVSGIVNFLLNNNLIFRKKQ